MHKAAFIYHLREHLKHEVGEREDEKKPADDIEDELKRLNNPDG